MPPPVVGGPPGPAATVWLTTLVFDGSHAEAALERDAVTTALAANHASGSTPATALVIRWDRADPGPRCEPVPVAGGLPAVLELVFAATFLVPLIAAATQRPARADAFPFDVLGMGIDFVNRLRDSVVPGTWALLLLATAEQVDGIAPSTQQRRPTARIATPLTANHVEAMWQAYGDDSR